MTIRNAAGNEVPDKWDYNGDGVFNHDDIVAYIKEPKPASMNELLKMQKEGGVDITAQDLVDLLADGGKVTGKQLLEFANNGGTLTADDLKQLKLNGAEISEDDQTAIEDKCKLEHTSAFPPGTTPAQVLQMAKDGVKISPSDLIHLKNKDGSPMFVDIKDLIKLEKYCGNVKGKDLIEFQKTGGKISGDDLVEFVKAGGKVSGTDLVTLAKGGSVIWTDDLRWLTDKCHIHLNAEQYMAINPQMTNGDKLSMITGSDSIVFGGGVRP